MGAVVSLNRAAVPALAVLVLGAVGGPVLFSAASAGAAARARTVALQADDFRFCDGSAQACLPTDTGVTTTVKVGTRVTWTYRDAACDAVAPCPGHNVLFAKGGGSKKLVKSQGARVFSMIFRKAGTYDYFCSAHEQFGMTGTIVVKR
jgi:hypothetical protein